MRLSYIAIAMLLSAVSLGVGVAFAQTGPSPGYGGSALSGCIYGFNQYDELRPIDAHIIIRDPVTNYTQTYPTYGGCYTFYLPAGQFSMTVAEPGFVSQTMPISTTGGGGLSLNFYLQQSKTPIPEFPTQAAELTMLLAILGGLMIVKVTSRRRVPTHL